jgi:Arc/MetJ-type ribon-helix-helix transcriptional regulator
MTIQLSAEHQKWLMEQVAQGRFATLDEAVAEAIEAFRIEEDDDDWVRARLAEGEAQIARGETIPVEVVFADLDRRIAKLRE